MKRAGKTVLLACLLAMLFGITAMADFPAVSESNTIRCYPWASGKDMILYKSSSLTGIPKAVPYAGCDVTAITEKAAHLVLMNQDTKEVERGWVDIQSIFYDPEYEHVVAFSPAVVTLYKGASVSSTPYVGMNPPLTGMEVGRKGSWLQMLFSTHGQYYMGWLQESTARNLVINSMATTGQVLADGVYTIAPRTDLKKNLSYSISGKSLRLAKASSSKSQKFRLAYQGNGYYRVTPVLDTARTIGSTSRKSISSYKVRGVRSSRNQLWKITRKGAYFYLYENTTKTRLGRLGNKVFSFGGKKTTQMQWQLKKKSVKPKLSNVTVFSQADPKWGDSTYMDGPVRRTIFTSGCGLLALTNAVYALNGEFIPPEELANFAVKRGHYYYNEGTADTLYADASNKLGKKYHFRHLGKFYQWTSVRKHLQKKHMVIANVPGHYIALVAYRKSDKSYLVLDSSVYNKRPTTIKGDWIPESQLKSGSLNCYYFHIFARR